MENAKKGECTWCVCGVTGLGEEIQVRVIFKGEMARKFKAVKEHLALERNTDVVKLELKKAYDRLPPEAKEKKENGKT